MNYFQICIGVCALCICANFGVQSTTISPVVPPIDFYGSIQLRNGETIPVRYLTIAGLYKEIPVYGSIAGKDENPLHNITRFDLKNIKTITLHHDQPVIQHKHRTFIPVSIQLRDQTNSEWHGLIETTRKIVCHQITAGTIELTKEITMDALYTLEIQGHRASKSEDNFTAEPQEISSQRETTAGTTVQEIHYKN